MGSIPEAPAWENQPVPEPIPEIKLEPEPKPEPEPKLEREPEPAPKPSPGPEPSPEPKSKEPEKQEIVWKLPPGGFGKYAERLESVAREETGGSGLSIQVQVIPDAFLYQMARDTVELARARYEGKKLEGELKKLYKENRSLKGKTLFLASLSGSGAETHYFFTSNLKSHFDIRKKSKKSFRIESAEPPPVVQIWSVFEYPPNQPRGYKPRVPLVLFKTIKLTLSVTTRYLELDERDPFTLTVMGIIRQTRSDDGRSSIRTDLRQISCTEWRQLIIPPATVTFYPGRWDIPEPPPELYSLLDRLK